MKAIIIAGGLGTRLRPLTYNVPKPIVPLVNRPFTFYQIELLKKYGITDIILNLHYLSDNIRNIFDDGKKLGVNISYSLEENPLGTAGAVKNAEQYFDNEPMLVFNGDILTDINLSKMIAFHQEKKAKVTIAMTKVEDPTIYGLIIVDENSRVLEFREKPTWEQVVANTINAGVYICDPSIFKLVPKGKEFSFERQLYPMLLEKGEKIYGYKTDAYWMDIGDPVKYLKAHHDIMNGYVMANISGNRITADMWTEDDANISKSAKVRGKVMLGGHSVVAEDVILEESVVLGEGVIIGKGAKLKNCVVHSKTTIGENAKLENCIIGSRCTIEDFSFVGTGTVLADGSIIKKGTRIGGSV
jgi:mannose-1-phosphate guanylyltransferase / phosphomannomutase